MAREGPCRSQDRAYCGSALYTWGPLGPSSTAFLGTWVGSWMASGTARTQTSKYRGSGSCMRQFNPLLHKTGLYTNMLVKLDIYKIFIPTKQSFEIIFLWTTLYNLVMTGMGTHFLMSALFLTYWRCLYHTVWVRVCACIKDAQEGVSLIIIPTETRCGHGVIF